MPRYLVERTFPEGLLIQSNDQGSEQCLGVVERNAHEGVTCVHSDLSEDKQTTICVYDAPGPEAIRKWPGSRHPPHT